MFPRTRRIRYNITLEVGFPNVLGLAVIPYTPSIIDSLNLLPMNYYPCVYIISISIYKIKNVLVDAIGSIISTNEVGHINESLKNK